MYNALIYPSRDAFSNGMQFNSLSTPTKLPQNKVSYT